MATIVVNGGLSKIDKKTLVKIVDRGTISRGFQTTLGNRSRINPRTLHRLLSCFRTANGGMKTTTTMTNGFVILVSTSSTEW